MAQSYVNKYLSLSLSLSVTSGEEVGGGGAETHELSRHFPECHETRVAKINIDHIVRTESWTSSMQSTNFLSLPGVDAGFLPGEGAQ